VGKETGIFLVCGLDIVLCILVDWEECNICLFCGLDIALCVIVDLLGCSVLFIL
jgi:hypothetical protein